MYVYDAVQSNNIPYAKYTEQISTKTIVNNVQRVCSLHAKPRLMQSCTIIIPSFSRPEHLMTDVDVSQWQQRSNSQSDTWLCGS